MLKPRVGGTGIDKACQSQLLDPSQTLHVGMFQYVKDKIRRDNDKSVDRIVDYFTFVDDG